MSGSVSEYSYLNQMPYKSVGLILHFGINSQIENSCDLLIEVTLRSSCRERFVTYTYFKISNISPKRHTGRRKNWVILLVYKLRLNNSVPYEFFTNQRVHG